MVQNKITEQRDLRDSKPYWQTTKQITIRTQKHLSSRHYDVVIVGGGISGALVTQAISNKKRTIAIIDRRAPVLGSSMASTAMIQHEIDVPLFKMSRTLGKSQAERIWLRSAKAVGSLINLVQKLNIQCQMTPKRALYLAGDELGFRALATEAKARQEIGLEANYLNASQLLSQFGIDRTAGIESRSSASANPAQLTAGLLRSVVENGAEAIQDMEITDFISLNGKVVLATSTGEIITATNVVFCTGYEFLKALAAKDHKIISTWAIASQKNLKRPTWLDDYLVWEASDPYLYFRTTNDGRLIAGGEDETSSEAYLDKNKLSEKSQIIAQKIADLSRCEPIKPEFRWSAAFGATPLGIPMIGQVPNHPNVYAAMGYGGNGITFSQIAADIITAHIDGRDDPDATLFGFR